MKKLLLNIEELRVDSFATSDPRLERGTVGGHGVTDTYTNVDQQEEIGRTILDCPTLFGCPSFDCYNSMWCESQACVTQRGDTCAADCTNFQCLSHDGTCNQWACGSGTC